MMTTALIVVSAVVLDWVLGEPRRFHPLIGFGMMADQMEKRLNHSDNPSSHAGRLMGLSGLIMLIVPFTAIAALLSSFDYIREIFGTVVLYLAIGHRSLYDHARPIAAALSSGDEKEARRLTGRIVSRDPSTLNIPVAATESVLENGSDSVFAALFWFVILGAPGVIIYRLANTLDAMWGYRSDRYIHFGWAAAKLDDALNYIPARLTALTYALLGAILPTLEAKRNLGGVVSRFYQTLHCWRTQAPKWDSPNAGPVMALGASALGVTLGGPAIYEGELHQRPILGTGPAPDAATILQALRLVSTGLVFWLVILLLAGGFDFA